jgi:hypothetical protein
MKFSMGVPHCELAQLVSSSDWTLYFVCGAVSSSDYIPLDDGVISDKKRHDLLSVLRDSGFNTVLTLLIARKALSHRECNRPHIREFCEPTEWWLLREAT